MPRKNEDFRIGYMDAVDFNFELGEAWGGNIIYPSVKNLKSSHKYVHLCGIVKVKVVLLKHVMKAQDQVWNAEKGILVNKKGRKKK